MNKKAEILQEQVVFILLNIAFLAIMIVFIYTQTTSISLLEEKYSKQIGLIVDSAKEGTIVKIDFKSFFDKIKIDKEDSIKIDNEENKVIVKGNEDSFYEFGFFNNVDVEYSFEGDYLVLVIKWIKKIWQFLVFIFIWRKYKNE